LENSLIKEKAQKKEFLASAGNSFFIDDVPERGLFNMLLLQILLND